MFRPAESLGPRKQTGRRTRRASDGLSRCITPIDDCRSEASGVARAIKSRGSAGIETARTSRQELLLALRGALGLGTLGGLLRSGFLGRHFRGSLMRWIPDAFGSEREARVSDRPSPLARRLRTKVCERSLRLPCRRGPTVDPSRPGTVSQPCRSSPRTRRFQVCHARASQLPRLKQLYGCGVKAKFEKSKTFFVDRSRERFDAHSSRRPNETRAAHTARHAATL